MAEPDTSEVLVWLDDMPKLVKEYLLGTPDEADAVDVLGSINSVITSLGEIKRTFSSEIPDGIKGKRYRVRVGRRATRSYSNRLLGTLGHDEDTTTALWEAIGAGAVKLTWNWSKLQQLAARKDVDLSITGHEILPDDGENDIGVVWKDDYARFEALEPGS